MAHAEGWAKRYKSAREERGRNGRDADSRGMDGEDQASLRKSGGVSRTPEGESGKESPAGPKPRLRSGDEAGTPCRQAFQAGTVRQPPSQEMRRLARREQAKTPCDKGE